MPGGDLPWMLLGVHSSRIDIGTRDLELDERWAELRVVCRHTSHADQELTDDRHASIHRV